MSINSIIKINLVFKNKLKSSFKNTSTKKNAFHLQHFFQIKSKTQLQMKKHLLLLIILGISISPIFAQNQNTGDIDIKDVINFGDQKIKVQQSYSSLDLLRFKSNGNSIDALDQIWEKISYSDPKINFQPGFFQELGDVNGDGFIDFIYRARAADERDEDISNFANKTLLFYGGSDLSYDNYEIYYTWLYPLGDLNGDGFDDVVSQSIDAEIALMSGSATGLTEVASAEVSVATLSRFSFAGNNFRINEDLNGDGIDDIYGYFTDVDGEVGDEGTPYFFEIYGSNSLDTLTADYIEFIGDDNRTLLGTFISDSVRHYVFNTTTNFENNRLIEISAKTASGNFLSSATNFPIPSFNVRNIMFEDYTGDGVADMIVDIFGSTLFYPGLDDGFSFFDREGLFQFNYNAAGLSTMESLGELDGDPGTDFIMRSTEGNKVFISSAFEAIGDTSGNNSGVEFVELIDLTEGTSSQAPSTFGSISSNTDVLLIPYFTEDGVGQVELTLSVDENSVSATEGLKYTLDTNDFTTRRIVQIWPIGDLTADGKDDFAVEIFDFDGGNKLWIYNGFDSEPIAEFVADSGFSVQEVFGGNFNGTDSRDIAILFRDLSNNTPETNNNQLHIYDAGNYDMQADIIYRSNFSDQPVSRNDIAQNLGDIDGDGYDEIGFGTPLSTWASQMFIYKGGETISTTPDQITDYGIYGIGGFGVGGTIQGIGDVNADGFDDFIVGDNNLAIPEAPGKSGALYLHYGSADFFTLETPITEASVQFLPDTSDSESEQSFFGFNEVATGDFDGDGDIDIAAKAFRHQNSDFTDGVGAIHYYLNNDGFTSQPDQLVPIKNTYINNNELNTEVYNRFSGRSLMSGIGDLDGDGDDELLFVPGSGWLNGIVYSGGDFAEDDVAILESPNKDLRINPSGNFINVQFISTVGDFTGDGTLSFITFQQDGNYRDQPIYRYQLSGIVTNNEDVSSETVQEFTLDQNYPNPFNPSTNISFTLPQQSNVSLKVYNLLGQEVVTLVNEIKTAGQHSVSFDASQLSSGMYIYRLEAGSSIQTRKMMLIK